MVLVYNTGSIIYDTFSGAYLYVHKELALIYFNKFFQIKDI